MIENGMAPFQIFRNQTDETWRERNWCLLVPGPNGGWTTALLADGHRGSLVQICHQASPITPEQAVEEASSKVRANRLRHLDPRDRGTAPPRPWPFEPATTDEISHVLEDGHLDPILECWYGTQIG